MNIRLIITLNMINHDAVSILSNALEKYILVGVVAS